MSFYSYKDYNYRLFTKVLNSFHIILTFIQLNLNLASNDLIVNLSENECCAKSD
jgi:hypothetical protein